MIQVFMSPSTSQLTMGSWHNFFQKFVPSFLVIQFPSSSVSCTYTVVIHLLSPKGIHFFFISSLLIHFSTFLFLLLLIFIYAVGFTSITRKVCLSTCVKHLSTNFVQAVQLVKNICSSSTIELNYHLSTNFWINV